ncbi:MAG TPA: ModE family transcriptional regulator [Methylotenera sp.]|nr:ModE family transcriptional regulator [Methylotenera sp.]
MLTIKIKIQIANGKEIAFGPGKAKLLAAINEFGSIAAAAKSMNMSYKRAWDLVIVMNASFKEPLVSTIVGGANGGGTTLTILGQLVLERYQAIVSESEKFVIAEMSSFTPLLA